MGFTQRHVEQALRRVNVQNVEVAVEWLTSHPESELNLGGAATGEGQGAGSG